jgi:transcriptional regulator with XRE-family HTH domain
MAKPLLAQEMAQCSHISIAADELIMAPRSKPASQHTGPFHAREARGVSRSELVRRSGISKQQLSRLENGVIRLRLDHLKPFAPVLGYTPEQILLWGKLPGTEGYESPQKPSPTPPQQGVPELDNRGSTAGNGKRSAREDGGYNAPLKAERWGSPENFVREQLHSLPERLVVIESEGDSMAPTIASGERVIVDVEHKTPSPDGSMRFATHLARLSSVVCNCCARQNRHG